MTQPDINPADAARVHYTDPRVRALAYARWHLNTGGTHTEWLMLGKNNPAALIQEARDWMRAVVALGLLPLVEPSTGEPLSPAAVPPVDRAALRDRIAEAVKSVRVRPELNPITMSMVQAGAGFHLAGAEADGVVDAVLGALPEPTNRAAVLREAADAVRDGDLGPRGGMSRDYENGWWNSRTAAENRIRRMADKTQKEGSDRGEPEETALTAEQQVRGVQEWMALDLHQALGWPVDHSATAEHQGRKSWGDWWAELLAGVRNVQMIRRYRGELPEQQLRRVAAEEQPTETAAVDLTGAPARCPLCPYPVTLHTPSGARAHFTAVHPEQRITGRGLGPWPLLVTDGDEAQPDAEQPSETQAHPPIHIWRIESPRRNNWADWASWGVDYDDREWAQERYEDATSTAAARPFRLVRATTTYTVEAEHTPPTERPAVGEQPDTQETP